MATTYFETPQNWSRIEADVITDISAIINIIFTAPKILFYDTCSFRYHSNLNEKNVNQLIEYFVQQEASIVLTRVIVMELGSHSGIFEENYITYIKRLKVVGIKVIVLDEEEIYNVLSVCFSRNKTVNEYLSWAVRMLNAPVSTISETLMSDLGLSEEVIKGKNQTSSDIYQHFFREVRNNKENGDNLGEEILSICLHILSHIPGMKDGKLCVLTDDKGGAGKIDALMRRTNRQYRGAKIIIYSTPKLIQSLINHGVTMDRDSVEMFLGYSGDSNIKIIATTEYDLKVEECISVSKQDLAEMLLIPGRINILF